MTAPQPSAPSPVGVDAGGTFTDLAAVDPSGEVRVAKVPSTPADPGRAVLDGLERLASAGAGPGAAATGEPGANPAVVHGTTVALNALLTARTGPTALITNRGFVDLIEIGRQDRPELYALHPQRPAPLVPRELRFEVSQRSWPDPGGSGIVEVDRPSDADLSALAKRVANSGVRTAAVCLLHSYADPEPERRIAAALRAAGVHPTCSGELLPAYREYERFATAVANAALVPLVSDYLERLGRSIPGGLSVLQSAGGTLPASVAGAEPVRILASGPAGGVIGAVRAAGQAGLGALLTLDMGGTSTDVAFHDPGAGVTGASTASSVGGQPIAVPSLDLATIGCGGGSLVRVDAGGVLRVGPESAGADPGPVAYGQGQEPTVTDAHVLLGHVAPGGFLGGELELDRGAVQRAFERIGKQAGLAPRAAAQAVLEIARAAMGRTCSVMGLQRGRDPRGLSLVAFGGGGGLHAAALAGSLDLPGALVPRHPGVLSALGMAGADALIDAELAVLEPLQRWPAKARKRAVAPLIQRSRESLREAGHRAKDIRVECALDLRYRGQSYEIRIPEGPQAAADFARRHAELYGWDQGTDALELVCLRVRCSVPGAAPLPAAPRPRRRAAPAGAVTHTRKAWIGPGARAAQLPCLDRERLKPGHTIQGPAILEEFTGTTLIPAGWTGQVLAGGHLWLQRNKS